MQCNTEEEVGRDSDKLVTLWSSYCISVHSYSRLNAGNSCSTVLQWTEIEHLASYRYGHYSEVVYSQDYFFF